MSMNLLPLIVAVPLGAAFLIPLLPRRLPVLADIIGNVATLAGAVLSVLFLSTRGVYALGGWNPPIGIDGYWMASAI